MIPQKIINNDLTNHTNRLSVQITLTGLSFLVTNSKHEVLQFSEEKFEHPHTPEELYIKLTHAFANKQFLQGDFADVTIVYSNPIFTTVPLPLFDKDKASEYLKFNTKILRNDYVSHDTLEREELSVVYVPFVNINNYIFDRFGNFKYYHAGSVLIKQLLQQENTNGETKVFVYVHHTHFYAVIIEHGKLKLCNSFSYNTPEDFIYYLLFCYEQLNLDPEKIETILMGSISKDDAIYDIIYTYIRNVSFLAFPEKTIPNKEAHQELLLKFLD
jgi:hypothetical protein